MNAVEIRDRIDYYNDLTRNARFTFQEYANAVNSVIANYVDEEIGLAEGGMKKAIQLTQVGRDRIYTLIKTANPVITAGTTIVGRYGSFVPCTLPFPTDYQNLMSVAVIIDSVSNYARPTDHNEDGPLFNNSFMKPTNKKPYYMENNAGLLIFKGVGGTFSQCTLTYLKQPATYSLSVESNKKTAGQNLTVATYYALETTVFMGVTYLSGASITGSVNPITSGSAILASLTTTCDLPVYVHDEIAKLASGLMLGTTGNYVASQFVDKEASKNI
jgi:hypothetical protein